jgi:multicomponent Na+:H+ antiporter subunit A
VPDLGIELSLRADGLALLFALAITGIGALVFLYAGTYLAGDARLGRLLALLLAFMSSMVGLVLADDAITLFVFWEATSITSYLLIGFDHADEKSRKSALQALLVTGGGGLALLAGLVLIGVATGTYRISEWPAHAGLLAASPLAPSPPRSRSTSGCRTPWRRLPRSPPTCTPRRW